MKITSCAHSIARLVLITVLALLGVVGEAQEFTPAETTLVSKSLSNALLAANADSANAKISRNGRFVVFESTASDLVDHVEGGVTPGRRHVYLLDRQAGTVEMVDLALNLEEAPSDSSGSAISNDGRYVTFTNASAASNFVTVCRWDYCHANKESTGTQLYVRDRIANQNMLVSMVTLPAKVQVIRDGAPVAEKVCKPEFPDCELEIDALTEYKPVMQQVPKRIPARHSFGDPVLCANPAISAEGRYIAYDTNADNLFACPVNEDPLFIEPIRGVDYDPADGILFDPNYVTPAIGPFKDRNGKRDIYVRDGDSLTNTMVSMDCKYHNPKELFCVQGREDSVLPSISDDGTYVGFQSTTSFLSLDFNRVNDTFIVERELMTGEAASLQRISNTTNRILAGNGGSTNIALSGDGRYAVFESAATNLVSGDSNARTDVFLYDRKFFKTIRCLGASSSQFNEHSLNPHISGNGEYVVFHSSSTNMGANTGSGNIYIGKVSKDQDGAVVSCITSLATVGSGNGGDADTLLGTVGLVPVTENLNGVDTRKLAPAIAFQSYATNLHGDGADTGGLKNIFQSPICTERDAENDLDGDGTTDCFDQCWKDRLKVVDADADGDGGANCEDACPEDSEKRAPGLCGCGESDNDSDGDGTPDCLDGCKNDSLKTAPGVCGCGFSDADANGNNIADCLDTLVPTPTPTIGATPVPTATPVNFSSITPARATVTRLDARTFKVRMYSAGSPVAVKKYRVVVLRESGSSLVPVSTTDRSNYSFNLTGLRPGKYRVRYSLIAYSNQVSQLSPVSTSFVVR